MKGKAAVHERQLIGLATHIESQLAWVRLVYDDHHAGDRLALTATMKDGFAELHLWRGSGGTTLHLLTDTPQMATRIVGWMGTHAESLSWSQGSAKRFAKRLKLLAAGLGATHARRATGFPSHELPDLQEAFGMARPLVGFATLLEGKKLEGPVFAVQELEATLWAAAVPIQVEGFEAPVERALLWDPNSAGFMPPREVRVDLLRRFQLPDIAERWDDWGFAGQPPAMVEPPLAPIDLRARAQEQQGQKSKHSLGDCFWDGFYCIDCAILDCAAFDCFDCDLPDCDLPGCDLDCIPCDF